MLHLHKDHKCTQHLVVYLTSFLDNFQIPPTGKGSLYIRPLLVGSGPVLSLVPASEYIFMIYVSPVGNYFKVGFCTFLWYFSVSI